MTARSTGAGGFYNKYGWIKEDKDRYIEGNYYKENHVLYLKKVGRGNWEVRFRNTFTGEESISLHVKSKKEGQKAMQNIMKRNPKGW